MSPEALKKLEARYRAAVDDQLQREQRLNARCGDWLERFERRWPASAPMLGSGWR